MSRRREASSVSKRGRKLPARALFCSCVSLVFLASVVHFSGKSQKTDDFVAAQGRRTDVGRKPTKASEITIKDASLGSFSIFHFNTRSESALESVRSFEAAEYGDNRVLMLLHGTNDETVVRPNLRGLGDQSSEGLSVSTISEDIIDTLRRLVKDNEPDHFALFVDSAVKVSKEYFQQLKGLTADAVEKYSGRKISGLFISPIKSTADISMKCLDASSSHMFLLFPEFLRTLISKFDSPSKVDSWDSLQDVIGQYAALAGYRALLAGGMDITLSLNKPRGSGGRQSLEAKPLHLPSTADDNTSEDLSHDDSSDNKKTHISRRLLLAVTIGQQDDEMESTLELADASSPRRVERRQVERQQVNRRPLHDEDAEAISTQDSDPADEANEAPLHLSEEDTTVSESLSDVVIPVDSSVAETTGEEEIPEVEAEEALPVVVLQNDPRADFDERFMGVPGENSQGGLGFDPSNGDEDDLHRLAKEQLDRAAGVAAPSVGSSANPGGGSSFAPHHDDHSEKVIVYHDEDSNDEVVMEDSHRRQEEKQGWSDRTTTEEEVDGEAQSQRRLLLGAGWVSPEIPMCSKPEYFIALDDQGDRLTRLAQLVSNEKNIAVVTANKGMHDLLINWLCYLRRLGLTNFLVFSVDPAHAQQLAAMGIPVVSQRNVTLNAASRNKFRFWGTVEYQKLILERTRFVHRVLQLGFNVLLGDIDAVWLKDPFPSLRPSDTDDFDIAGQRDTDSLCGGFLYLRNTRTTRDLWSSLHAEHEELVRDAVERGRLRKEEDSEQLILEQYLKNKKFPSLKIRELDHDLFPHGQAYFENKTPQTKGIEPIVVHNNYIKGMPKKVQRFKEFSMWAVDAKGGCSATFMKVS
mmetsp:Transcript_11756/g.19120  ORF Transcript_11756/g.19120 Transcript_11756/m.19120 type:complete len:863 (-) Transcript_11756:211-2799(-)